MCKKLASVLHNVSLIQYSVYWIKTCGQLSTICMLYIKIAVVLIKLIELIESLLYQFTNPVVLAIFSPALFLKKVT